MKKIAKVPIKNLIFIDESGANLEMTPRYGRGRPGERVNILAPYGRKTNMTMISAISIRKVEAAMYGEWAANAEIFLHFIETNLVPVLKKRHVVVMDNVPFHLNDKIVKAIEGTGAKVVMLPPYSPELNPIECMWSKLKTYMRKISARTPRQFKKSIRVAYKKINGSDLKGWFNHCGYIDQFFREPL